VERKRILVVDDEKNIRFTVVHSLQGDDFQVDDASNGVEGIRLVSEHRYDLLLIDLRMPGMTGIEMLREIRRIRTDLPPAILITAYGVPEQLLEAAKLGAIDYIRKPFSIQTIRSTVTDIFSRFQMPEESQPESAADYVQKAKRDMMMGHRPEADTELRRAIELDPQMTEAYTLLGLNALLSNDTNAARDCFQTVLMREPSNRSASEYLAWIAEEQG
jgi:DNA-binding response OmpR family regulator